MYHYSKVNSTPTEIDSLSKNVIHLKNSIKLNIASSHLDSVTQLHCLENKKNKIKVIVENCGHTVLYNVLLMAESCASYGENTANKSTQQHLVPFCYILYLGTRLRSVPMIENFLTVYLSAFDLGTMT